MGHCYVHFAFLFTLIRDDDNNFVIDPCGSLCTRRILNVRFVDVSTRRLVSWGNSWPSKSMFRLKADARPVLYPCCIRVVSAPSSKVDVVLTPRGTDNAALSL